MKINNFTYFYPEKPRLITKSQSLFDKVNNDLDWIGEYKYNGSRLQLHNYNGKFYFWDRHYKQLSYRSNDEILNSLNNLNLPKKYNLFDGELRHNKVIGIRNKIILYDVFIWNGEVLLDVPFESRRKILENISGYNDSVSLIQQFSGDFHRMFEQTSDADELEGIVIKNKKGILNLSRTSNCESSWMLKVRKQTGRHRF